MSRINFDAVPVSVVANKQTTNGLPPHVLLPKRSVRQGFLHFPETGDKYVGEFSQELQPRLNKAIRNEFESKWMRNSRKRRQQQNGIDQNRNNDVGTKLFQANFQPFCEPCTLDFKQSPQCPRRISATPPQRYPQDLNQRLQHFRTNFSRILNKVHKMPNNIYKASRQWLEDHKIGKKASKHTVSPWTQHQSSRHFWGIWYCCHDNCHGHRKLEIPTDAFVGREHQWLGISRKRSPKSLIQTYMSIQ